MALLVGAWEALVGNGVVQYRFLPAPSSVWSGARMLIADGELGPSALHTLRVTLVGWVAAGAIGILLGLILGLSKTTWRYSMATIEVLRAVPAISFAPIAVLIFGFSAHMELVLVIYVSQWPVLISTVESVRSTKPQLLDVARILQMSRLTRIRKITLPAAMPFIVVGLRLSLALALVMTVVAEMVGNPRGLGYELVFQQQALQAGKMFAYVVTIGLLGVGLNGALVLGSRCIPGSDRSVGGAG